MEQPIVGCAPAYSDYLFSGEKIPIGARLILDYRIGKKIARLSIFETFRELMLRIWSCKNGGNQDWFVILGDYSRHSQLGNFLVNTSKGLPEVIVFNWGNFDYMAYILYKIYGRVGNNEKKRKQVRKIMLFFPNCDEKYIDWIKVKKCLLNRQLKGQMLQEALENLNLTRIHHSDMDYHMYCCI